MAHTLAALIETHADDALAIGAPEREWMSYGALRELCCDVAGTLHSAGIGRGDRVAIVLPNGPEMAAAFVAIAQTATTCPLNPAYRTDEFAFYLEDLSAKAIVLARGEDGPAFEAAKRLGLSVLWLDQGEVAGSFTLEAATTGTPTDKNPPEADDIALILHTSGTTSRPKIVPLTQSNIATSAMHIRTSLALTGDDRCLNVMPLFHIHGLVAAVSASLAAGAQVWCAPGFDALRFFGWMRDARPSWYTAVPTMHQAILARAKSKISKNRTDYRTERADFQLPLIICPTNHERGPISSTSYR